MTTNLPTPRIPKPLRHYANEQAEFCRRMEIPFDRAMFSVFDAHKGYSRAELQQAFDLIQNQHDWKAPMDALIPEEWLSACAAAAEFYTGETFTDQIDEVKVDGIKFLHVRCTGYRADPARI